MSKSERVLARWAFVLSGDYGPILAGSEPGGADYRTSTPLVAFDPEAGTGITASGRPYRLVGEPDPAYVLEALYALWTVGDADIRVVGTDEALTLIAVNAPFDRSEEEQAEIDAWKLPKVAAQIRLLMLQRGLDADEAARAAAVEPDRLAALLDGSVDGWTASEADRVFDILAAKWRTMRMS